MKKITPTDFLMDVWEDLPEHERYGKKSRYNGGWIKEIIGLNKKESNGYSLKGSFLDNGIEGSIRVTINKLYLDCDIQGSRNNQEKIMCLFSINNKGDIIIYKHVVSEVNWAIELWDDVDNFLKTPTFKNEGKLISECTNEEIFNELSLRGVDFTTTTKTVIVNTPTRKIEMDSQDGKEI